MASPAAVMLPVPLVLMFCANCVMLVARLPPFKLSRPESLVSKRPYFSPTDKPSAALKVPLLVATGRAVMSTPLRPSTLATAWLVCKTSEVLVGALSVVMPALTTASSVTGVMWMTSAESNPLTVNCACPTSATPMARSVVPMLLLAAVTSSR